MTAGSTIGSYTLYTGSVAVSPVTGAKYGVSSGSFADSFKDVSALGTSCSVVSTSTSTTATSTVTSTSASATPTLQHKPVVGNYSFQGCYTEATGVRALSDKTYVNSTSMTNELCASTCAGYTYFGTEYHEECQSSFNTASHFHADFQTGYCGNVLASTSTVAPLSDCYHVCPGDQYE